MRARNYLFLFILTMVHMSLNAQVTGTVFNDFNSNGTKDNNASYNENGIAGVSVIATKPDGNPLTVSYTGGGSVTNSTGEYIVSGGTLGQIRLEFTLSDAYTFASHGPEGGTTVMFPTTATQDLGVLYPGQYSSTTNPDLVTTCFVTGDINGNGATQPIIVGFKYLSTGDTHVDNIYTGQLQELGSLWGVAYDKYNKIVYSAAVARRHSDFGPSGIAAIYRVDYTNPASPAILDNFELSSLLPTTPSPRTATSFDPGPYSSYDPEIFDLVGKISFGDIDISEDGQTLYVMNLTDRSVYAINISNLPTPLTAGDVTRLGSAGDLDPGCSNSDYRPWALKVHKGNVYAGVVCTGQTSGDRNELAGWVLKWDGTSWATEFGPIDLTYTKGPTTSPITATNNIWNVWVDNFYDMDGDGDPNSTPSDIGYPQPILSDIEFDVDDSMILGFMDRTGNQAGRSNRPTNTSDGNLYSADSGGEILRVCNVNGTYVIEGAAGSCDTPIDPSDPNNNVNKGINNQEYYWGDFTVGLSHFETSQGALALLPGKGEVLTTSMVPINARTGGVRWLSNFSGATVNTYEIVDLPSSGGGAGKANGLGDLELLNSPAPIEIGNRVWVDTDGDSIQDAGEAPISGVTVQLVKDGTVIATATTDANGNYYFSSAVGTNTASAIYGIAQLMPNMQYIVRIPNVQGGSKQAALGTNSLTTANGDGSTNGDLRDSDGILVGNNADVTVQTTDIAVAGANNHTFDFGFSEVTCVTPTATASATNPTCAGTTAQNNGMITISGFTAGQRYQYSTGATFNSGAAIPASITTIPVGGAIVNNLANTSQQYTVRIFDATDNACFVDRTVSITAVTCGACACKEYVYVNEPGGNIHKLEVNPTTAQLTEVGGINGIPWVNNPTVFPSPHGLGVDRNGFLYIGTNFGDPNSIRKLGCDGSLFPETGTTGFKAPVSGNWGFLLTNIQSYDGFIYANGVSNRIYKIDPCTGNNIGYIVLGTDFSDDWGLYIDKNGKFYATQPTGKIFVFTPVASDFTSNTIFPFLIDLGGNPTYGGLSPQYSGTGLQGIVTDNIGNIYVVEGNRDFGGTPSRLLKFSSTGTFIAAGPVDNLNNGAGWCQMTGIIYSETSGKLYTTSMDPGEDCVFIWNTNLTPVGAAIGPVPTLSGQCKAIGILSECCPLVTQTINEVICSGGNGEKFSLQEMIDCGDGIVCEGQWQEISNNSNGAIVFDECDLTIIVNGTGCAEYRLSKTTPASPGQQCGVFSITVIICTEVPSATVAGAAGTCTGSLPNNDAVINITAATNATQAGISTGATYSGPAFNGVGTMAITGGTAAFTGRMHNTQYTIRIFNGANDCYTDYTVTTPTVTCCALTVTCTPQPQTNCTSVNGSASVSVTGAVGTVTYLWSSGEMTSSISNKAAGTYTVTVTDGGVSGCSRTCEAIIANNANAPTCTITVNTQPSCTNLTGGNITVVPSPAGTYTYIWSDNGAATANRTGLTGGTYTVTVTNTASNCTGVCNVTLDTPINCCNINAITAINLECLDNGTPAKITDNRIRFRAMVTNTNASLTSYNVTINGGTTIMPNTNVPYGVTQFTLGPGTAGGGATFTITVTDSATPGCSQTFQVTDPGNCTPGTPECPPVQCGTATIQVNGN